MLFGSWLAVYTGEGSRYCWVFSILLNPEGSMLLKALYAAEGSLCR